MHVPGKRRHGCVGGCWWLSIIQAQWSPLLLLTTMPEGASEKQGTAGPMVGRCAGVGRLPRCHMPGTGPCQGVPAHACGDGAGFGLAPHSHSPCSSTAGKPQHGLACLSAVLSTMHFQHGSACLRSILSMTWQRCNEFSAP